MTKNEQETFWSEQQRLSLRRIKEELEHSIDTSKNFGRTESANEMYKTNYDRHRWKETRSPTIPLPGMDTPPDYGSLRGSKYSIVPPVRKYDAFERTQKEDYKKKSLTNGLTHGDRYDPWKSQPDQSQSKSIFNYGNNRDTKVHFTPRSEDYRKVHRGDLNNTEPSWMGQKKFEYPGKTWEDDDYSTRRQKSQVLSVDLEREIKEKSQQMVPYRGNSYKNGYRGDRNGYHGYISDGYQGRHSDAGHNGYRLSDWYGYRPAYGGLTDRPQYRHVQRHMPMPPTMYGGQFPGFIYMGPPPSHPYYHPSAVFSEEFLQEELEDWTRDIVRQTTNEIVDQYLVEQYDKYDPLEDFLDSLLSELMRECCTDVVKNSVQELAYEYIRKSAMFDVAIDILTEVVQDDGPSVIHELVEERSLEEIVDELEAEEVKVTSHEVAMETLTYYNKKMQKRDFKEVKDFCSEKQLDSMCLEYLLSLLVKQGRLVTESDHSEKLMNNIILNMLLEQYLKTYQTRNSTIRSNPIRKLHAKLTTDMLLDVLVGELRQTLAEDMEDIDFYEHGEPVLKT